MNTNFLSLEEAEAYDHFGHMPLYISDDGQQGHDPLALVGKYPHFSLSKLALYLSVPAIVGEFLPDCPWQGVTRVRSVVKWPTESTHIEEFIPQFQHSLSSCIGNAATVAVALSGGLDSLAILYHASQLCVYEGRKLIAVTADLYDDNGQGCASIVQELIRNLSISCDLHCVSGIAEAAQFLDATWWADGPRIDAMPGINRVMADRVEKEGADVLLTGSGADELLGAVRYLMPHLLSAKHWRDAHFYLHDLIEGGGVQRLQTEILAALSLVLPHRVSNMLYWATNWPELSDVQAPSILAKRFRPQAEQWTSTWLRSILTFHQENHRVWAVKDAWDALFPFDKLPPAGNIPEREPFLQPSFIRYVMSLSLEQRYSSGLTPYHRRKALVLSLYPQHFHPFLPRAKQLFSRAFANYQQQIPTAYRCIDYGLVSKDALDVCTDASLLGMVSAIEQWIAGAEKIGATAVE